MYKLTDRRLNVAEEILDNYREKLVKTEKFNVPSLERELRDMWSIGYQELKDIMLDILKNHDRYKYVALYYMEYSNAPGVVSEFKRPLADAYGISHYHSDDRDDAQQSFWKNAHLELSQNAA